jgi:alkylation response protein AidB-like acyl-CoA dehydrogenase
MAGASIGIARASLEAALRYAKEREAFGHPIADYQAVKLKLANMALRIDAARLLTINAAAKTQAEGRASAESAMAKVFASETCIDASLEAMRIHGGYGYTAEFPIERFYRDAPLMAIGEGMNDILMLSVADGLLAQIR